MNILSIGGSDPSSGAGIQSDIKAISSLNGYCFTVVTAITSQNTSKFSQVDPVSSSSIKNQIDSILSDFSIDAIKVGMVYNSSIIKAISSKIKSLRVPIVVDPVIKSTTGGTLLKNDAISDFKKFLIPIAYAITPNVFEAEKLSGIKIKEKKDLAMAAKQIRKLGVKNVIITGYEFDKTKILDFVLENSNEYMVSSKKIKNVNHGSGCNYSAALVNSIALGKNLRESAKFAKLFTINSINNSTKVGKGVTITQSNKIDGIENELSKNIIKFTKLRNIYLAIPECQTNFVYTKPKPKSLESILGVSGRIVKSGKSVLIAGNLEYGGSKHVASAVLKINKKFPEIRSAINIKFDEKIIKKFKKKNFVISQYDRKKEPSKIKKISGSSVFWGINQAIKNLKVSPDVIFHEGDFGKEPMILVFGKNPSDVIKKISNIF